ncbi:hypothetical protein FHT12_002458 [Xanthomonas campestris]|uniref:hypothetical protein n=1 Tax=Xanthomonas euroxanthea TaxID=2259622 RepID=UPI000CEF3C0E|nr:hypothetical protein [Xanthomonas euroxanthea]NIJ93761.1 hypothetical protein [Xanthomonas euroxanthea]PPT26189.1 hypothetical protein XaCFBP7622_18360 [Xanthomonas arboricola]
MSKALAEIAYDLHSGLASNRIPEFDDLQLIGMAGTLAVHIKGLGQIDYEVLRKVSDHLMGIPSFALERVLRLLNDVQFVRLVEVGKKIVSVIPNIPVFDDVYVGIGKYAASECSLNEHEQATIQILSMLQHAPVNKSSLVNTLGAERSVFDRCLTVGKASGIVSEHQARGRDILISPFYFSDNLDGLADAAVACGSTTIKTALEKVKANQGWPLSVMKATGEIGGVKLSVTEIALVDKMAGEGMIRPPTIAFGSKSESFLFTPKPGSTRLNASNREVYERAMALISAVRKGQLLPNSYQIRYPVRILESLRDKGYLGSNSEAREQYQNLVVLKVAYLKQTAQNMWQLCLNRTPENEEALTLAITLLRTGELSGMEVNNEARIALGKGEEYIQSLISATEIKKRQREVSDPQAAFEFEQLLLKLG